ncbi:MAG: anaerobic ribonucleoside-triphosphate reductase [Promethearchaeota archaeon]
MDSDKNTNFLEKHLKTLGQTVRIDILKKLNSSQYHISFSKLQKEVLDQNLTSVNFSFHLNELKKREMIDSNENGYFITKLGKDILGGILSIEEILIKKNKKKMIRTSKYSKELFDLKKIEEYLITEGGLENSLAQKIAREVEERLAKTDIEYLTAPLMREYINAILLENGLEEVRHKLTRLGTPPYEVSKLFNLEKKGLLPDQFIKKLGSDVSEQYLLLNLIPKNLADLYLSGEIALLNLNYWALRPLGIYLDSKTLIDYVMQNKISSSGKSSGGIDYINLILALFDFLHQLKHFYSTDVLLGNFSKLFLADLNFAESQSYLSDILASQMLKFNNDHNTTHSHLTLGFSGKIDSQENQNLKDFLNSLSKTQDHYHLPLLAYDYSNIGTQSTENTLLTEFLSDNLRPNTIFFNNQNSSILNSTITKIEHPHDNKLILDKILINLHMISVEAKQNDDLFLEILENRMESVFDLYHYKTKLVEKKLNPINKWDKISQHIFGDKKEKIFDESIKSISFFGLNKAILNHCGIELERTDNSTSFALEVLSLMKRIIEERNETDNNHYIFNQPHKAEYLGNSWHNDVQHDNGLGSCYSSKIIREECSIPITKKVAIFKKFEPILSGGSLFTENIDDEKISVNELTQLLVKSKINAFSLNSVNSKTSL